MITKGGFLKQSNSYKEESKSTTSSKTTEQPPQVYKKSGIILRAQDYEPVKMENLWSHNKDNFEIKKQLLSIGYKPLDRITD